MTHRFLLVSLLCAPSVVGCFQEIDSTASKKYPTPAVLEAGPPIIVKTPDIETPDGGTAANPCEATTITATSILTIDCSGCHYGPGSPSGADWDILNFEQIKTERQNALTPTDPTDPSQPMRLLVPGVPENGRIYLRAGIDMPKPGTVQNPTTKPTVSDRSVLLEWITNCMGPSEAPPAGTGGATGTGGARGTGGATGTGGSAGTGGSTGMGGARGTGGASAAGGTLGTGGVTGAGGRNGRGGVGGG